MTVATIGMTLMVFSMKKRHFLRSFTGDLVILCLLFPVAYLFAKTMFIYTFYSFITILVWYIVLTCFLAYEVGVTESTIVRY